MLLTRIRFSSHWTPPCCPASTHASGRTSVKFSTIAVHKYQSDYICLPMLV